MKIFKLFIFLFAVCFTSCFQKKIDITTEYIINENWTDKNVQAKSIMIEKMKVKKDSIINPFSDLSQGEILEKLEVDSSFRWFANVSFKNKESYKEKKIYFGKDNGFTWWKWDDVDGREINILGNLEINTWYSVSGLVGYPYFVYVYVDSTNQVHRFDINMANY